MAATIIPFLKDDNAFDPKAITAMCMALDDVCDALQITDAAPAAREIIAVRIIELASRGERSPTRLRDRVLAEAHRRVDAADDGARLSPGL
jgi:hypothetical protein